MNAQQIEARRTELFRLEASGAEVPESDWLALGDAQNALNAEHRTPEGYWR